MDMNFTSDGDRIALMMMIIAREMANMMAMAMITANLIVILRYFFRMVTASRTNILSVYKCNHHPPKYVHTTLILYVHTFVQCSIIDPRTRRSGKNMCSLHIFVWLCHLRVNWGGQGQSMIKNLHCSVCINNTFLHTTMHHCSLLCHCRINCWVEGQCCNTLLTGQRNEPIVVARRRSGGQHIKWRIVKRFKKKRKSVLCSWG